MRPGDAGERLDGGELRGMPVKVDRGKLRLGHRMLRDDECRLRLVLPDVRDGELRFATRARTSARSALSALSLQALAQWRQSPQRRGPTQQILLCWSWRSLYRCDPVRARELIGIESVAASR